MAVPTDEQKRRFVARAAEFAKTHPDFPERIAQAQARVKADKVDLPLAAANEIIRLGSPETFYTILTNSQEAARFHVAEGEYSNAERDADKVRRLHSRLVRNQTFQTAGQERAAEREAQEYLEKRREAFRSGKRRRR